MIEELNDNVILIRVERWKESKNGEPTILFPDPVVETRNNQGLSHGEDQE